MSKDKYINYTQRVSEGRRLHEAPFDYEIYHASYADACLEALRFVKAHGYEVIEDDWYRNVSTGPRKPDPGKSNSLHVALTKNGKACREYLHFQVYNLGNDKRLPFEMTCYIN